MRSALVDLMWRAAEGAGRALRRDFGEMEHLRGSGAERFAGSAVRRAGEVVRRSLLKARPEWGFDTDGEVEAGRDRLHRWLISPVSGLENFKHGLPHFGTVIVLERGGEALSGAVYNPVLDEFFSAERGRGAFLNDRRLRVSAREGLEGSLLGCGGGMEIGETRRLGCLALEMCWTAAGRLDGFCARDVPRADMLAGQVLLRESGALVSDWRGGEASAEVGEIAAAGPDLHEVLVKRLADGSAAAA